MSTMSFSGTGVFTRMVDRQYRRCDVEAVVPGIVWHAGGYSVYVRGEGGISDSSLERFGFGDVVG